MKRFALLTLIVSGFLAGCFSPAFQTIGAIDIQCQVVEFPSMTPIQGASAVWSYVGPNGESVPFAPFTSDAQGIFCVIVPEQKLGLSRIDGYFAGGYFREIKIEAPGFESGNWHETDLRERVDHSAVRPVEFRLQRKKPSDTARRPEAQSWKPLPRETT